MFGGITNVWMPFLIIGLLVFVVSLMTRTQPGRKIAERRT